MTEIVEHLLAHRSYRDFDPTYELPKETLAAILKATRQAPSWMNGQFYSIIVVSDDAKRRKLVELNPGNPHILNSSIFLIFVADLNRSAQVSQNYQADFNVTGNLDALITAVTDASLAAENTIVAAESFGLGTCPIGSVRRFSREVIDLFELPEYTLPLLGLAIGKPIVPMKVKPRLPEEAVIHYDRYQGIDQAVLKTYDQEMAAFGEARETKLWTEKFANYFIQPINPNYSDILKAQKFL